MPPRSKLKAKISFTLWLDALAIILWGILLLKLWLTGQLYLLIHPSYKILAILSGLALLFFGIGQAWQIWQRKLQAAPHQTLLLPQWSSGLLIGTAILGLVISPRPFASDTAFQRGVGDSLTATRAVQSFRANRNPQERSLVEWIRTLNVYPEPDAYQGQKAKVQGFVVYPTDFSSQFFLLTRFVITCCAADVYPVSLPVKISLGDRSAYPADKWLEVEGKMITETINGKRQLTIEATNLSPIPEPKNPYES